MKPLLNLGLAILTILCMQNLAAQQKSAGNKGVLFCFRDNRTDTYGYKNKHGKIIIPAGKYQFCFTDTFRNYAIVMLPKKGFVAIDRNENVLYEIYPFDNGPDYESEGLFRIVKNGKIGFASAATGSIIIQPQYACAWPFEKGKARVSQDCETVQIDEHDKRVTGHWFYINKKGMRVAPPAQ